MSAPHSRSGEGAAPPTELIGVILAVLILRLIVGGLTHLTEDEAYYRLWSMAPALGYYDHPPMIAWWIWLGRLMAGNDALGVRLLPILASVATSWLVFDMARLAGAGRKAACTAGIWFNAAPLVLGGGFLAVPDAPASLFFSLSLWCALKAGVRAPLAWWSGAGLAAGLACLSKYSALFIAPGMLLWLVTRAEGRKALNTPGPWLALAIAVALFAANLSWNAEHHWLTLTKQFARLAPQRFAPAYLGEFLATQFFLLNPLIAIFAGAGIALRRKPAELDPSPFILVGAPFAAYLLVHSLHDRVQPHWPAPLYPLAAVIAVAGAQRLDDRRFWRGMSRAIPLLGGAFAAALLLLLGGAGIMLGRLDPALAVRGWGPFAAKVEQLRRQSGAAWIATSSYGLAAQLLVESSVRAPVFQFAERDRWQGLGLAAPKTKAPGLAIDLARRMDPRRLQRCFASVRPLGEVTRGAPGEPGKAYAAFAVSGPKVDLLAVGC